VQALRRLAVAAALVVAVVLGVAALPGPGGDGYRVDAIFDNTASLIPGQDVKIAGARVGSVVGVELTDDLRARVQMEVDPRFGPFRRDAACIIRPQSLVGEKFVQCDPGTPKARELRGDPATVPLARNSSPVDLDVVFSTFGLPYRERFTILLNELGAGLAGRPADLSEAIRRANPALRETNEVLALLDRDRTTLGRLIERTDAALAELDSRRGELVSFVERARAVTETTAGRRGDLSETVRRLPPLLAELEPSAQKLGSLARTATPATRTVRAATPAVRTLVSDLEPLNDAVRPALVKLAEMARTGRRTVRTTLPVARDLHAATELMPRVVPVATEVVESLRDKGAVEGIQRFLYFATAATARFDRFSHILPSYQIANPLCMLYATTPVAGCSAHFGDARPAGEQRARRRSVRRPRRGGEQTEPRDRLAPAPVAPQAPPAPQAPAQPAPVAPAPPPAPAPAPPAPAEPERRGTGLPLLDYLLGGG
jgi:phospholipid/cholesterol/gamma-HCH transport system substrate-binding protein